MILRPAGSQLRRTLGVSALFSGCALLAHILTGLSLVVALSVSAGIITLGTWLALRRASGTDRDRILGFGKVGLLSGLVATIVYDVTKAALSRWEPSPYDPFEAVRVFGVLLVGQNAPSGLTYAVGAVFHLGNGVLFGLSFVLLFGSRGVLAGIGWGLFLELFQLTLYPGWLDIRFYREFVQISGLSHIAYGAVLGLLSQRGLRKLNN